MSKAWPRAKDSWPSYWAKVRKTDGCWLWTGTKDRYGYGQISVGGGGKVEKAHRIAYDAVYGPITEGMNINHFCDMPSCVRPSHLWQGTQRENLRDMYDKGRANPGGGYRTHGRFGGSRRWPIGRTGRGTDD